MPEGSDQQNPGCGKSIKQVTLIFSSTNKFQKRKKIREPIKCT